MVLGLFYDTSSPNRHRALGKLGFPTPTQFLQNRVYILQTLHIGISLIY